ncbi:MAG: ABC transporter permease subunit [Alphaproteobacteria bacterium]|nr:ABC transporter permease subunit [Alphaproteobacteria bacterium]MCB9746673.1 ABC transporter permease subunit [Alphaproteobacteria bacterium]
MRTVLAIFRRELSGYFDSPLAYIVIPTFLLLVGLFSLFFNDLFATGLVTTRTVMFWSAMFLLLLVPALTMRLFAEEKRTGSLELLVTLPIGEVELVLGKYLAALALILIAVALTFTYPLSLAQLGELDWGPVIGGYVGLALAAAAWCAIGTAASALTSNQIVAFLIALGLCVVPYVMGFFLHRVPGPIVPLVQYLSFDYHFNGLARGVLDTRNIVFFGGVIGLFLHVAVFALEQRRLD